jgi:hypothetical protein
LFEAGCILLDDAYYEFIVAGRREVDGLPWVGEDRLIPLKVIAWLNLTARKEQGEPIRGTSESTSTMCCGLPNCLHLRLAFRLRRKIADDMTRLLRTLASDASVNPKSLQLGSVTVAGIAERIAQAYELDLKAP